jgi:non-canonical purine NTP pyrophosphatase (RdgB/HAM1 family)
MPPVVFFVTSSAGKYAEAKRAAEHNGIALVQLAMDLVEIQGTPDEIIAAKLDAACACSRPPTTGPAVVMVEDTSLEMEWLCPAAGPYIRHILDNIGVAGIHARAVAAGEFGATACCRVAARRVDPASARLAVTITHQKTGTIVQPAGDGGFGWDAIFRPTDEDKTFAEMEPSVKDACNPRVWAFLDLFSRIHFRMNDRPPQ